MRPNIDYQGLMDIIKVNEKSRRFDLNEVISSCGTHGCAVGNWLLANNIDRRSFCTHQNGSRMGLYQSISYRFGISFNEAIYLFCEYHEKKNKQEFTTRYGNSNKLRKNSKKQVLNRIRKFIYYHLKKREFCLDDRGVTKVARETGHVNFGKKLNQANLKRELVSL